MFTLNPEGMIKTTLTFQDPTKLEAFVSSQELTNTETSDNSVTGYFEHDQIEIATQKFGATALQVEDGKPTVDSSGLENSEILL